MREAKENERILARLDVHEMLMNRAEVLRSQTGGNLRTKIEREAQATILWEMINNEFRQLEELSLPLAGRTVFVHAAA